MRVWIETWLLMNLQKMTVVTLYVRVWIETAPIRPVDNDSKGHPLREGVD